MECLSSGLLCPVVVLVLSLSSVVEGAFIQASKEYSIIPLIWALLILDRLWGVRRWVTSQGYWAGQRFPSSDLLFATTLWVGYSSSVPDYGLRKMCRRMPLSSILQFLLREGKAEIELWFHSQAQWQPSITDGWKFLG